MKSKILALLSSLSILPFVHANQPFEKFSYCSNGVCGIITTDNFYYNRKMPRDLNFSCKKDNQYALTFDDGPSVNYPRLLEILARHNVKATFFVIGVNAQSEEGSQYYSQMAAAGHFMANHTLNHPDLTSLTAEQIYEQAEQARQIFLNLPSLKNLPRELVDKLQTSTKYVRPPFGNIDEKVDQVFKKHGFTSVRWNADRYDWQMPGNDPSSTITIAQRVAQQFDFIKKQQKNGVIFNNSILDLNHDRQNSTIDALEVYIPLIKERGYTFVTMDECLQ